MNPISNTAFFTCGSRVEDTERRPPICDDIFEHGYAPTSTTSFGEKTMEFDYAAVASRTHS